MPNRSDPLLAEICDDVEARNQILALVHFAFDEDLQGSVDMTSEATVPPTATASVNVVARQSGTIAGLVLFPSIYQSLCQRFEVDASAIDIQVLRPDGSEVSAGDVVASVSGPVRLLLTGERTALNFLIHLSGIATLTAEFVKRVSGTTAAILDTRKTLPAYRQLHKYAVRCGGGTNHRMGLYDGMLIKDNHLAANDHLPAHEAVASARRWLKANGKQVPVEVEVDTLEQLHEVLKERPDIVLLDNMTCEQLSEAVAIRNTVSPATKLEASGGVNLSTVSAIAHTGVDRISVGALTHSAVALDFGFDWQFDRL